MQPAYAEEAETAPTPAPAPGRSQTTDSEKEFYRQNDQSDSEREFYTKNKKKHKSRNDAFMEAMDERMIQAHDPTSFGSDTITADDRHEEAIEKEDEEQGEHDSGEKGTGVKKDDFGSKVKDLKERSRDGTVIREDVDWGDQGKKQPVLLQHGHAVDSAIWFKEKNVGKPLPL